jgi:3-oxoadipate enol-lactonase
VRSTVHVAGPPAVDLAICVDGRTDAPPLLLANSLGTDASMWDRQVPVWSATRRVLRYDQRGHGASSAPPGPYTIDQLGHDALAVLDAEEVDRADVVGLSLGGVVALWLAVHAPDRVGRLVLADTAARVGTEEAWRARAAAVRDSGMAAVVDLVIERFFSATFRATADPVLDHVREGLRDGDVEGYAASCEALATADLRDSVGRVVAPTLVVVGSDDAATPPDDACDLQARIPGAVLRELSGAGHLANLEQPDAFAALVVDFLAVADDESRRA